MESRQDDKVLKIRNMVCDRCISTVKQNLKDLGIAFHNVDLGEVALLEPLEQDKKEAFSALLSSQGFELLENKTARIIDRIKVLILNWVRNDDQDKRQNLSAVITDDLNQDYHQLTSLFSSVEGITIERYAILQRIEFVKELLFYDELTLSEVAYKLGYSSVAHLSGQFKKTTGLTPSDYKKLSKKPRQKLDKL